MGSDDSHFNISLIVRETKSQDSVHRPHILKKGEAKGIRTEVPLLTSLRSYLQAKPAHQKRGDK